MADGPSKRLRVATEQLAAAVASGNVSSAQADGGELLGLSAATVQAQAQHAANLRAFEAKQRQNSIIVPVKEDELKNAFRALGQPICLFGERLVDKRERLKRILAERQVDAELLGETAPSVSFLPSTSSSQQQRPREEKQKKSYFSIASDVLIEARQLISNASWSRAKSRLEKEYNTPIMMGSTTSRKSVKLEMVASLNEKRPISGCSFSPDGFIFTSSFEKKCRVYRSSGDYGLVHNLQGHEERVCDIAARPVISSTEPICASGSGEGQVRIWRGETCMSVLSGHVQRVGRLAWHPMGRHVCSTSYDRTWRMWDGETSQCLLMQDGYAREVYGCAWHPDGALFATGDLGAAVVVWDIRSGRVTHQLSGHVLGVLTADFSSNGHQLATGGLDNQVRIWDLRKKETLQVIPAHVKPITRTRFSHMDGGGLLVTASQDRTIRVWNTQTWSKLASLVVHEGPVMGMDVTGDLRIVTSGYDKSLKVVETR